MFRYPSCNLSTYDRREFPGGTVYNGDCLDVIKTLPESSVDCIVTDPPYFLGMTHNGQKGNFCDLSICRPFYRDLFNEFRRVCRPEACIYFFCDWRGYAFYYPLFDEILKAHNMLVWNKLSGPGNHYAFIHELILFHAGKGANIGGTNIISDIRAFTSGAKSTDGAKVHPTQKPVALIQKFIEDATAPGAVILDTFGGSGSTAVAAVRSGRRFILMEQDEGYYHTTCKRLENEYRE
jgi:site-specific DNA-methyltransferase (adenine-specific)